MNRTRSGFTLIELSIVLVIIGLIVGGVLVGQDLIKGAEIRAQISQFEKYDAAANTFRNKYGALPGDIENAANFGLDDNNVSPNGDGRINRNFNTTIWDDNHAIRSMGEAYVFFRHLSQTNLINENIVGTADYLSDPFVIHTDYFPAGKMGSGAIVVVAARGGRNNYFLIRGATTTGQASFGFSTTNELRVIDAFQIDNKTDDGVANTGRVITVTNFVTDDASGDCHASGTYATAASANQTTCMLQIRTSF